MDLLVEDVMRLVIGFCDGPQVQTMALLNTHWTSLVRTSKLTKVHNPMWALQAKQNNSTKWTLNRWASLPILWPYINHIEFLSSESNRPNFDTLNFTKQVDCFQHCTSGMTFKFDRYCFERGHLVQDLLKKFAQWERIECETIEMLGLCSEMQPWYVQDLTITSSSFQTLSDAGRTAFAGCLCLHNIGPLIEFLPLEPLRDCTPNLVLYGLVPVLDNPCSQLKSLDLHTIPCFFQELNRKSSVPWFQSQLQGLESFSLINSNVTNEEMTQFEWVRWPRLKHLNLECNYTLNALTNVPTGLSTLRLAFTNVRLPLDSLEHVQSLSASICMDLTTAQFLKTRVPQLRHIALDLTQFWSDSSFFWTSCSHLETIRIHFKEYFASSDLLQVVRKECTRSLVQRWN